MFTNDTLSTFDGVMFVLNSDQGGSGVGRRPPRLFPTVDASIDTSTPSLSLLEYFVLLMNAVNAAQCSTTRAWPRSRRSSRREGCIRVCTLGARACTMIPTISRRLEVSEVWSTCVPWGGGNGA
jgi:hypothetical protein